MIATARPSRPGSSPSSPDPLPYCDGLCATGEGKGYQGCAPHYALRAALSLLTNVDVPEGLLRLLVPATQHMNRQQMDEYLLDYIRQNMARNGIRFEHHVDPPPL